MTQTAKDNMSAYVMTRIEMLIEKEKGLHPPPDRDSAYSFGNYTNVIPHHDASTMFLILRIIEPNMAGFSECLFKVILFRTFISNPLAWNYVMEKYEGGSLFTINKFVKERNVKQLYKHLAAYAIDDQEKEVGEKIGPKKKKNIHRGACNMSVAAYAIDDQKKEVGENIVPKKQKLKNTHRGAYNIGTFKVIRKELVGIEHPKIHGFTLYLRQLVKVIRDMSADLQRLLAQRSLPVTVLGATSYETALDVLCGYHEKFDKHQPTTFSIHLVATSLMYIDSRFSMLPSPRFVGGDKEKGARGGIAILNDGVDIPNLDDRRAYIDQAVEWLNNDHKAKNQLFRIQTVVPAGFNIQKPYTFEMGQSFFCEIRKLHKHKNGEGHRRYCNKSDGVKAFHERRSVEAVLTSRAQWHIFL